MAKKNNPLAFSCLKEDDLLVITGAGGREKAPAAICRKVIEAKDKNSNEIVI